MSIRRAALLLVLLLGAAHAPAQPPFATLEYADLGPTRLLDGGHAGLVLVLSDAAGMPHAEALARAVGARGRSAALVDTSVFLARRAAAHASCIEASTLLDVYAQQVQQTLRFEHFGSAALVGFGQAAAFVSLVLAQAPSGVFAAGLSAGGMPALELPAPPCGELAARLGWTDPAIGVSIPADLRLSARWRSSADDDPQALLATLDTLLAAPVAAASAPPDLPLIELPQPNGGTAPWFALVISGDGGWANIDKDIGEMLGAQGIAVLGWNSLRYFWEAKTPETAGADLARAVRYYTQAWRKPRVLLIGFSMGADVLPFMVSRAPPDVRAALAGMVLLSPANTVDFQFHISNWLGSSEAQAYALGPEMQKIGALALLCVYGSEDDPGLCQTLAQRADTRLLQLPGDHHYGGDYAAVTRAILDRFPLTQ